MDLFTRQDLTTLLADRQRPCASIYMPTRRGGGEQDHIRLRVHLAEVRKGLVAAGMQPAEATKVLKPARQLLNNESFWKNQGDGLALFLAPEFIQVCRLPITFGDCVTTGDRFHIKPLLPLISGNGRFFVLALSQNSVRLLQGTRDSVREVDLRGVPKNLAEALGAHDTDEVLTFHTRPFTGRGRPWTAIFHGHGVGSDDNKDNLSHYFQRIDKGLHPLLREEKAPLLLAAVDYLQPIYRNANTYPHLMDVGIHGNPERLSNEALHDEAWKLVQPIFEQSRQQAAAKYLELVGTGRTAQDPESIVCAAARGEIQTLFIALNAVKWGHFDPINMKVEQHQQPGPGDVDLIDFAAAQTLTHGHQVFAVEANQVPGGGCMAAIFCLPMAKRGSHRLAATTTAPLTLATSSPSV